MKRMVFVMVVNLLIIIGISTPVFAKQGFYLGIGVPYNTIGGDFDGESALFGGSDFIIVPEIDGGFGYGFLAGFGFSQEFALELSYLASSHDAEFLGAEGDVDYSVFNIDLKFHFMTSGSTQPYLLAGVGIHKVVVVDGSATLSTPTRIGDAEYQGVGFNLGVGIDHYLSPHVSIGAGATYRFVEYDEAEGVVGGGEITDALEGDGLGLMLSAVYHF